ncbi:MAG: hypothetical protein KJ065_19715 [Anaerolineae bacterium]|nr:hypothetical protein [Anaerolineae bacterium]
MAYSKTYVDLLERFSRRGCAICGLLLHDENRYIDSLLYEFANDAGIHKVFRRGRGFCNHHSWLLAHQYGYSLGVSILFEAALDAVLEILESENSPFQLSRLETVVSGWFGAKGDTRLAGKLEPEIPCPACVSLCKSEALYIETFAEYWSDTTFQSAYEQSQGLCLPHFRDVLRLMSAPKERAQLAKIQRAKWEALKGELELFQAKSVLNYVGEPFGAEVDSWRRVVASMTGGEHALLNLTRPR